MTKIKNPFSGIGYIESALSDFCIEIRRSKRGMTVQISGVISVFELTEETVGILTPRARVYISGKKLLLSVFECRRVEVCGKVEDVCFKYGKG
jgi:hypothetical protein